MTDDTPDLKKLLHASGYRFFRMGRGDPEIWQHAETGRKVVVDGSVKSRHTANGVLKQAGLPMAS
ncbi:type II toxin-antitoxin system HicA family toxin [Methylobacterium sp. J-030]|uniref:type II toxin-antitoxin system HicA family toxin n=1 Tax=Methylobacterium sp. J-030 TaxID=2836627 RepID=UPI001FB9EB7E|nr:type II toxin-antitoxin system HicA family toxin [Methylobacterium sp. J-030]MCJ2073051.1 type II toxin-antitoxin system HicA family toxin [Methylobacterium sp. J-030]